MKKWSRSLFRYGQILNWGTEEIAESKTATSILERRERCSQRRLSNKVHFERCRGSVFLFFFKGGLTIEREKIDIYPGFASKGKQTDYDRETWTSQ